MTNLNSIVDPSAQSVLDLLVHAECEADGTAEPAVPAGDRGAWVARELDRLGGVLRQPSWARHTTGVHFVRLLADLIGDRGHRPGSLHEFVDQTIDPKRNAFRPYRVSQYVRTRYGVGITNHTVQRMLGLMADAGKRRDGRRPTAARRSATPVRRRSTADGVNAVGRRVCRSCLAGRSATELARPPERVIRPAVGRRVRRKQRSPG